MLKLLFIFFSLFAFRAISQYGTIDSKIPTSIDPEVFCHLKDSLNAVDTVSVINFDKYYDRKYDLEMSLYWFDEKKEHLNNCIKWCSAWCFHTSNNPEPLIRAMEVCKKLDDKILGQRNYDLILKAKQKEWNPDQKRRIDDIALWLSHEYLVDMEYSTEESFCEMDTIAEIHFVEQKTAVHELISEGNHYLELKINTKKCRCRDCSYSSTIFIKLPREKLPVSMDLDSTNCFYSVTNTWIYEPKETINFGKFYRDETGLYLILACKNNPADDLYLLQTFWISPGKIKELY